MSVTSGSHSRTPGPLTLRIGALPVPLALGAGIMLELYQLGWESPSAVPFVSPRRGFL